MTKFFIFTFKAAIALAALGFWFAFVFAAYVVMTMDTQAALDGPTPTVEHPTTWVTCRHVQTGAVQAFPGTRCPLGWIFYIPVPK